MSRFLGVVLIAGFGASVAGANSAPMVTDVTAAQRTDGSKIVDIGYDLADVDGDPCTVTVVVSDDGGSTWDVPAVSLTGNIGAGITPGTGKAIVWDCGADLPGAYGTNYKVRVYADDGQGTPTEMALIPAGEFEMGDHNDGWSYALPVHTVYLDAFYIGHYEVTKGLWDTVRIWATSNGYDLIAGSAQAADHPVHSVNWFDCVKWCNARSQQEGRTPCYYTNAGLTTVYRTGEVAPYVKWDANGYRLPTEAEWERAARGGQYTPYYRYPWGDTIDGSKANYWWSGDPYETGGYPQTTPVGYYDGGQTPAGIDMANGYGLYDMAGNVNEWCNDWWYGPYSACDPPPCDNPPGPANGTYRVLRGGSWYYSEVTLRCAMRYSGNPPDYRDYIIGFRLALDSDAGVAWGDSPPFGVDNRSVVYVDDDNCPGPGSGTQADPFCSIQDGIVAASNTDTVLVAPGTYNETINFIGKAITVRSSDGQAVTIIDATGAADCTVDNCSVVKCVSGEGAGTVLDGLTITGGTGTTWVHPGGNTYLVGGGMYNENSSPTLTDCTFSGNSIDGAAYSDSFGGGMFNANSGPTLTGCTFSGNVAGHTDNYGSGGGMYNESSSPTLTSCTFSGNTTGHSYRTGRGGGMYNDNSNPTLTNCTFSENAAAGGGGGIKNTYSSSPTLTNVTFTDNRAGFYSGGGMDNVIGSSPMLTDCTFVGNWAFYGGGMRNYTSSPTLLNCTFADNLGHYTGGGMDNDDSSSPVLTNCIFTANHASAYQGYRGYGGGMSNYDDSSPTLINCMFSGNSALRLGAGIYSRASSPTVINSTFSGNSANYDGGGMYIHSNSIGNSNPTVTNCTFSGNAAGANGNAVACDSPDQQYPSTVVLANCILWERGNEIWNNDGSTITITYSDIEGGWTGDGNIDVDPLFTGGPSGTWTANATYDETTAQTTFTDSNATFVEDELLGAFLNPNTTQSLHALIVSNTATQITVWGDFSAMGATGEAYQVYDYHLLPCSPVIDAGDNTAVPGDASDLDDDGDMDEPTPFDLDGNPRFADDTGTPDTGNGTPPIVDMGAYEFAGTTISMCGNDIDCDDGLFCTGVEVCIDGCCRLGSEPDCSSFDDNCNTGVCNTDTDQCEADPTPHEGAPCDDGLYCNENETCQSGVCAGGTPTDCSTATDQCNTGVCNEDTDECEGDPTPHEGNSCDDGLFCTVTDVCSGGQCIGSGDPCPGFYCDEETDECVGCFEDIDCDGKPNNTDNCLWTPNGSLLGTCVEGSSGTCVGDGDCGTNGLCSMDQEDSDEDGVGDACDTDDDDDGWPDAGDNCPTVANAGVVSNGDGVPACEPAEGQLWQVDTDCDGHGNACDNCPDADDSNPAQEDSDGDGVGNACDNCLATPNGPHLGTCVAGSSGTCRWNSQCDTRPGNGACTRAQEDTDGDGAGDACDSDIDGDTILNGDDNCPLDDNPLQEDEDEDGVGDVCDLCPGYDDALDFDCDGEPNASDNCPNVFNPDQLDTDGDCPTPLNGASCGDACDLCPGFDDSLDGDGDSVPTDCDNCPDVANGSNQGWIPGVGNQTDRDDDCPAPLAGAHCGDACDLDIDGDGVEQGDGDDPCPTGKTSGCDDNCSLTPNGPDLGTCLEGISGTCVADPECESSPGDGVCSQAQEDSDGDGIGDVCDECTDPTGVDTDEDGVPDVCDNCSDVPNPTQANLDGADDGGDACDDDDDNDGWPDVGDNCRITPNGPDNRTCTAGTIGEDCMIDEDCNTPGESDGVCGSSQSDFDSDGVGDVCDNCPNTPNPSQQDLNENGVGDACECVTSASCDDGNVCTVDACGPSGICEYSNVSDGAPCQDDLFCNGEEACASGHCISEIPPCSDGVMCTVDTCDEVDDTCEHTPDDGRCDNGLFCDGEETCDSVDDCQSVIDPCPGQMCDEDVDECWVCALDSECADEFFCNGDETCEGSICQPGKPYDCTSLNDDCNVGVCNEDTDACEAQAANEGGACAGLACYTGETCQGGACLSGSRSAAIRSTRSAPITSAILRVTKVTART